MRIRTIKLEVWTHPVLSRLTDEARLVAIGLLNVADDEGFFMASPALVRSALYPFDEDSTRIRRVLAALSRVGYIEVREHPEQGEIGCVINFKKHQRIDRPNQSKIKSYFDSTNDRRMIDDDSLLDQGREQGTGKGKEQGTNLAPAPLSRARNELFDAIVELTGQNPQICGGEIGKAIKAIKSITQDVTPAEIRARAANYPLHFKDASLSASAMAKWWTKIATPPDKPQGNERRMSFA